MSAISVGRIPRHLIHQERDWTCALACLRTMMSCFIDVLPEENILIVQGKYKPGPIFSDRLKKLQTDTWEMRFGCDDPSPTLTNIISLLDQGWSVMLESMYNYSHWMVLIAYFKLGNGESAETDRLLCYDPYYHDIRLINADEFNTMWMDGNHSENGIRCDYLALRPSLNKPVMTEISTPNV